MDIMLIILLGALVVVTLLFAIVFLKDIFVTNKNDLENGEGSFIKSALIGFVTDFFDTLGIGSYATSAAAFRATKEVDDELLPGTLNVAHTIPVILEAFIFITAVNVAPVTLIVMIVSATIGGWFGAGIISKLNKSTVQLIVAIALLFTAFLMLVSQTGIIDSMGNGTAISLTGNKLIIGAIGNFILGILMSASVGLYAPCMALVYFLGLSPEVAFPIMMGSCAFLMPVSGVKFIKEGKYARKQSLSVTIGGVIGVIVAAFFLTNMPIDILTWLVIIVILYTSINMLIGIYRVKKSKINK